MKYPAAVAMMLGMLALPALGQQGAARGVAGGRAGAAPHGFSAPAPRGFSGGFAAHGPIGMRPGGFGTRGPIAFRPSGPRFGQGPRTMRFAGSRGPMNMPYRSFGADADHGGRSRNWPHDRDRDHHRHHRMIYWNGGLYPYGTFFSGYPIYTGDVDPWLFGPDDYDQDQPVAGYSSGGNDGSGYGSGGDYGEDAPENPQSPYAPDPGYAGQYGMEPPARQQSAPQAQPPSARQPSAARQPYTGSTSAHGQDSQEPLGQGSSAGLSSPSLTVIFKDGRPVEHISNYMLTADTLTVYEPHYRQIPLEQVNLEATKDANLTAGVDFRVPGR